jgi:hypothetical protein
MNGAERKKYVVDWKLEKEKFLNDALGYEDGPQYRFLAGILFAPSSSKVIVPHLQDVIQADGAHTSFGKYTLFTAYGTTANGNMSPLAFGIMFGNEDTGNWTKLWEFVKEIHPSVNALRTTILTDQDKGSTAAISEIMPEAHQFHCSYHRRQNIIKNCGGHGQTPLTALWMYNLLCGSNNMSQLESTQKTYYPKMHPTDRHYLTKIDDRMQYPAARCSMGPNICMYGHSASSGVESMNNANDLARKKAAVDILNAAIKIIQLEGERFAWWKEQAWNRDQLLTAHGMTLMEEAFKDVNIRDYAMKVVETETYTEATVSRNAMNSKNYTVIMPKEERLGSRFGSCTCGKPAKDGVPCQHMVVLVKSYGNSFTRIGIMPYWLTTAHWRVQYPEDLYCRTDITMKAIQAMSTPEDDLRFCPSWSAVNKKGRPKKNERIKSVMDHIEESAKKKRRRTVKYFCKNLP